MDVETLMRDIKRALIKEHGLPRRTSEFVVDLLLPVIESAHQQYQAQKFGPIETALHACGYELVCR